MGEWGACLADVGFVWDSVLGTATPGEGCGEVERRLREGRCRGGRRRPVSCLKREFCDFKKLTESFFLIVKSCFFSFKKKLSFVTADLPNFDLYYY